MTYTADPGQATGGPLRQALTLIAQKRGIRCNNHNDGTGWWPETPRDRNFLFINFTTDRHTIHPQLLPIAIVGLYQGPNRIVGAFHFYYPRRGSYSTFKIMADHPCSATHIAFCYWARCCRHHGLKNMFSCKSYCAHIIQKAIKGLGHHRQIKWAKFIVHE